MDKDAKLKIESLSLSDPEILDFEKFGVYIFAVYNSTDIRGIIVDEERTQKIKKLAKQMKLFYNSNDLDVKKVLPGNYYAVFDDVWHRVKCINFDSESLTATVYFIDRGDEDFFSTDSIQLLPTRFFEIPAQAIRLSLSGLEIFHNYPALQDLMEDLFLENEVCVKVLDYDKFENGIPILSVELIFEKDEEGDQINVNKILLEHIYKSIGDPRTLIGPDKVTQEAYISCVSDKVYVQIKSIGLFYLKELIEPIIKLCFDNQYKKPKFQLDMNKFYIIKNERDCSCYRVQILEIINELEVKVIFIDFGNTDIINKENLILLNNLSKVLADYPPQAIEVKLHRIPSKVFDETMANYLRELVQPSQIFYMKTVVVQQGIPVVQLCKRAENNYLLQINNELLIESSLSNADQNDLNSSTFNLDFDFPLHTPNIPEEDDTAYDVLVSVAVHPEDISLQPYCGHKRFETLMKDLTSECELYKGPKLTPIQVQVGYCYAAKHDEHNSWYRAYVYKVLTRAVFAVYACDYGEYKIVDLRNLQPLEPKFRETPYQAIKAKLLGINQEYRDNWTIEDSVRFVELFASKSFVSIIRKRELNKLPFKHIVLTVELIDTSTEEDINMADLFNNEKRNQKS